MMRANLDEQFEAYLTRDDDALIGSQFFETLAEIERRERVVAAHPVGRETRREGVGADDRDAREHAGQ